MWDRKELKAKGKAAYRANRMACIIAALLLMITSGAGYSGASAGTNWKNIQNNNDSSVTQDVDDLFDENGDIDIDGFEIDDPEVSPGEALIAPAIIAAVIVIVLVAIVLGTVLGIFVFNPLQVGLRKFFIENANDHTTGLSKKNVGAAFGENYMKIVGSMFTTGLFTALWTLLLIIPGIYKAYCWRLVPYIISEDPAVTGREAREQSAKMMDGSKWASFVLDLSFIGWKILGAFTLGILNLVFTNPYQDATDAELYLALSGRPTAISAPEGEAHAASAKPEAPEVVFEFDQEEVNE